MTKVITRYFENASQAHKARNELLYRRRVPRGILHFYDDAKDLADALKAQDVAAKTAKAYQDRVAKGGAVLLIRAGFKPLSVAQTARDVMAQMGGTEIDGLEEEVYVEDRPTRSLSILPDHPRIMTRPRDPYATNFYMADWPIPLISRRKPFTESVIAPHGHMAGYPVPLITRRRTPTGQTIVRDRHLADILLPLISRRKPYTKSIFSRHKRMADFPLPLISRRKPYTGSLIKRDQRMANWPFPLLINGEPRTNSLIPGAPYMADFPIPLLSDRKPMKKSIVPSHARMANFPLPLISRRKPYAETKFPRHARMADYILPLIVRRPRDASGGGSAGFSLSRLLGLPTIIRR